MRRRILIINPDTSEHVTELLAGEARRVAAERADVVAVTVTAPAGAQALQPAADLDRARAAVIEVIEASSGFDAAIIGAFADPGLDEVREAAPIPVFGLGRSGLQRAAHGGRPFAIVTLGNRMRPTIERAVAQAGLGGQVVALHFLDASLGLVKDRGALVEAAMAAFPECIKAGADAVLFGGALFAGMEALLGEGLAVSAVDGLTSAMHCALDALPSGKAAT